MFCLDELELSPGGLDEDVARRHIFQVLRALAFCHNNNVSWTFEIFKNGFERLTQFSVGGGDGRGRAPWKILEIEAGSQQIWAQHFPRGRVCQPIFCKGLCAMHMAREGNWSKFYNHSHPPVPLCTPQLRLYRKGRRGGEV